VDCDNHGAVLQRLKVLRALKYWFDVYDPSAVDRFDGADPQPALGNFADRDAGRADFAGRESAWRRRLSAAGLGLSRVVSTAGGAYHARSWCSDQNVWSEVRPESGEGVCRAVRVLEGYCEK
jgi:hypothetical protein